MKRTAIAALSLVLAACAASVDSDDDGTALEPIVPGPCATACLLVANEQCDWSDDCGRSPQGSVTCGPRTLTCGAAEEASAATAYGVSYCYRSCEGLN
jgi:hypothetical protein